jgi:hypothetical protein
MTEKTFILGVGAQKAATTWLHYYLSAQQAANMGPLKEYHALSDDREGVRGFFRGLRHVRSQEDFLRLRLKSSLKTYARYFARLTSAPGVSITGDITPRYALLSQKTLSETKAALEENGLHVKPVFILRDPVERCWSGFKMALRNTQSADGKLQLKKRSLSFLDYCRDTRFRRFSDYTTTINNLTAVFPRDDIYLALYETLFSDDEVTRLSKWLGVPEKPALAGVKTNFDPNSVNIDDRDFREAVEVYRDVYASVQEILPESVTLWRGFRV